jgi:hypothetical protein
MFAPDDARHERLQLGMGEGDVRPAERRHYLDPGALEVAPEEHDDGVEAPAASMIEAAECRSSWTCHRPSPDFSAIAAKNCPSSGRAGRIRTGDLLTPSQAR